MDKTASIYDDRYARGYRSEVSGYEAARWTALAHFLRSLCPHPAENIVDYGCGSGLHLPLWKMLFPHASLHACDISAVALQQLRDKHPDLIGRTAVIEDNRTCFTDGSFDLAISVEVMEHVLELRDYLREIRRILRTGGRFVWTTPCGNALSVEHIWAHLTGQVEPTPDGYRRWKWEEPTHVRRLKSRELTAILRDEGFAIERLRFRAHAFSFFYSYLLGKIRPARLQGLIGKTQGLMALDYGLFRCLPNGASMIGCARKLA